MIKILYFLSLIFLFSCDKKETYPTQKNKPENKLEYSGLIDTLMYALIDIGARANYIFVDKEGDKKIIMSMPNLDKEKEMRGKIFKVMIEEDSLLGTVVTKMEEIKGYRFNFENLKQKYKWFKLKYSEYSEGDFTHFTFKGSGDLEKDINCVHDSFYPYETSLDSGQTYYVFYRVEIKYIDFHDDYFDFKIAEKIIPTNK